MSKPIFIMRVPYEAVTNNRELFEQAYKDLQTKLSDYHVLCMTDPNIGTAVFECYNAINAEEKDIVELKQLAAEMLNTIKNKETNEQI